jgi:hypothetical protein
MKKSILYILAILSFTVNGQTKLESSVEEYFDGVSWEKSYGTDYEYDNNKNLLAETNFQWTISGWSENSKTTYTYNSINKVSEQIESDWDGISQFEETQKTTYTYNSEGKVSQTMIQYWNGSQWENSEKEDYTYTNSRISMVEFSEFDGSQWESDTRFTTTYTGTNLSKVSLELYFGPQWEEVMRIMVTHNASNKIVSTKLEEFDGSTWTEFELINYDLDANFNRLKETDIYDGLIESKTEYTYDLSAQLSSFAHPFKEASPLEYFVEEFPHVNKVLTETYFDYDTQTSAFTPGDRTTYNYNSQIVLGVEKAKEIQAINLYPNPANDFIQINGITKPENVTVYTVLGVKVFDAVIKENEKLDVQGLNNGLYLLKFENGTALKFLKK